MGTLSLRLSESIHRKLAQVTEHEGISIDQVVDLAIAEKLKDAPCAACSIGSASLLW